jgi:hypothetical protein
MKISDGGKGSKPRPFSVTQEEYDNRWEMIFQKDLPKEESKETKNETENRTDQVS